MMGDEYGKLFSDTLFIVCEQLFTIDKDSWAGKGIPVADPELRQRQTPCLLSEQLLKTKLKIQFL